MGRILPFLLFAFCASTATSQIIWQETFNGLPNGTIVDSGSTAWSIDLDLNCGGSVTGSFAVHGNRFRGNDTDCDAIWQSEWIDVSAYTAGVRVTAEFSGTGGLDESGAGADTAKLGYRVNGNSTITWVAQLAGTSVNNTDICGGGVSPDSIQIILSFGNTGNGEFHYVDNVTLEQGSGALPSGGGDTLFSRQDGDWDQGNTWANTFDGSSCNCTPDSNSVVYITCGYTVLIDNDEWVRELYVQSGAHLEWDSGDDELNVSSNGVIEIGVGGDIWESGQNNAWLHFEGSGTHYLRIFDSSLGLEIDQIQINNPCSLIIEGIGRMDVEDDFVINANDVTVVNNKTGQIYIADDFHVNGDNLTWLNDSGYMYIDGQFNVDNPDMNFVNRDTVFIDEDLDCNNADDGVLTNYGFMWVDGDDIEMSNNTERFVVNNYGWFRLDDDLIEVSTGVNACEWHNREGGYFELGHNDAEVDWEIYANYDSNTIDYFRATSQAYVWVPQDAYWNLTLSGSGAKQTLGDLDINGTVRIEGSAVFDPATRNDNLNVAGSWFSTSSAGDPFLEGTNTVTFDGTGRQVINRANANGETFYNVIINKDDSLRLNSDVQIAAAGGVTFTDGHVSCDSVDRLIFNNNATVTGASNASFVDGRVQKTGNDAFTYPVGDNGDYQPLAQSAPVNTGDAFEAQYYYIDPRTRWDHESLDGILNHVSTEEYWIFNRTSGTGQVSVTLAWDANSGGVDNLDSLAVARWDGAQWTSEGNGGTTGSTSAGTVTSSGVITNYSPFTLGSVLNSFILNPLPVTLISFEVTEKESGIELSWTTMHERDVDHYYVEKQTMTGEWEGKFNVRPFNKSYGNEYARLDSKKAQGWNQYRLFELTNNGERILIGEGAVYISSQQYEEDLVIYPNPASESISVFLPEGIQSDNLQYTVIDNAGVQQLNGGFNSPLTDLDIRSLKPGMYTLKVSGAPNPYFTRFIKQ